jgi:hypothetical protein
MGFLLNTKERDCKPGSVPLLGAMVICLGRQLPVSSCSLPGTFSDADHIAGARFDPGALAPYLALLRVGFAVPRTLPLGRWALTPPFHPCLFSGCPEKAVYFLLHFP